MRVNVNNDQALVLDRRDFLKATAATLATGSIPRQARAGDNVSIHKVQGNQDVIDFVGFKDLVAAEIDLLNQAKTAMVGQSKTIRSKSKDGRTMTRFLTKPKGGNFDKLVQQILSSLEDTKQALDSGKLTETNFKQAPQFKSYFNSKQVSNRDQALNQINDWFEQPRSKDIPLMGSFATYWALMAQCEPVGGEKPEIIDQFAKLHQQIAKTVKKQGTRLTTDEQELIAGILRWDSIYTLRKGLDLDKMKEFEGQLAIIEQRLTGPEAPPLPEPASSIIQPTIDPKAPGLLDTSGPMRQVSEAPSVENRRTIIQAGHRQ